MSVSLLIDVYARPSYQQTVTFPGNDLTTRKRITGSCVFSVCENKNKWTMAKPMAKLEKEPPNIVHQNAILCETITKEQRHQKLYTNYSVNPFNKSKDFRQFRLFTWWLVVARPISLRSLKTQSHWQLGSFCCMVYFPFFLTHLLTHQASDLY